MKIINYIGGETLGALLELIGSIGTLFTSFMKDVTDEEIEKNIKFLNKYEWFQSYFDNEEHKKLISEDDDVRFIIGKINIKKMKRNSYRNKTKKKLEVILQKNLGQH